MTGAGALELLLELRNHSGNAHGWNGHKADVEFWKIWNAPRNQLQYTTVEDDPTEPPLGSEP